jgi:hypothetical protein
MRRLTFAVPVPANMEYVLINSSVTSAFVTQAGQVRQFIKCSSTGKLYFTSGMWCFNIDTENNNIIQQEIYYPNKL